MGEINRKKIQASNQPKHTVKAEKKVNKVSTDSTSKPKETESSPHPERGNGSVSQIDSSMISNLKGNPNQNPNPTRVIENGDNQSEEESDCETLHDSVSSQGDSHTPEDEKVDTTPQSSRRNSKVTANGSTPRSSRARHDSGSNILSKKSQESKMKSIKSNPGSAKATTKSNFKHEVSFKASEPFAEVSQKPDDGKEDEIFEDASNASQTVITDDEAAQPTKRDDKSREDLVQKLEMELRAVATLEISLYSVVPEHGSSSHKVHTPARRLSRFYIHACKYWSQDKSATIARNIASGIVLVAKSCGSDVPRLTFWLSNIIVLREIVCRTFGSSCRIKANSSDLQMDVRSSLKWTGIHSSNCWKETRTLVMALEKVESWIFSRIVESVWWQALTPNMQSSLSDMNANKPIGRLPEPALDDQHQGHFSIDLWKSVFLDAFQRICPVRGGGHKCGCLPILAKMVMEHCVVRLDVAMFNAILRESAHEIPTDPISDPIIDMKVLPIPAGDLSFGSGAQLKNAVGNWSRLLSDMFSVDGEDSFRPINDDDEDNGYDDDEDGYFNLLNSLSDLLMLPKDMLVRRSVRMEVCPSIDLQLIKRILCNFTPDEFCPDPVPGAVLEALNAERESAANFPRTASPVVYIPPSTADVGAKVAEIGERSHLARSISSVQEKGYTSDEELEELESPLSSIIDKAPASPAEYGMDDVGVNIRYMLLREVWSS